MNGEGLPVAIIVAAPVATGTACSMVPERVGWVVDGEALLLTGLPAQPADATSRPIKMTKNKKEKAKAFITRFRVMPRLRRRG